MNQALSLQQIAQLLMSSQSAAVPPQAKAASPGGSLNNFGALGNLLSGQPASGLANSFNLSGPLF